MLIVFTTEMKKNNMHCCMMQHLNTFSRSLTI